MNEAFLDPTTRLYVICAAVLVIKMSFTGYATAVLRNLKGVFISPEDVDQEYDAVSAEYRKTGRVPPPRDALEEELRGRVRDRRTSEEIDKWTRELREKASRQQRETRARAEAKLKRSRARIHSQAARSRRRAQLARAKAVRSRDRSGRK